MWTLPNIEVYESYNERSRKHNSGSYIIDLEGELVFPLQCTVCPLIWDCCILCDSVCSGPEDYVNPMGRAAKLQLSCPKEWYTLVVCCVEVLCGSVLCGIGVMWYCVVWKCVVW